MPQLNPIQQFAERLAQERREKAARERRDLQKQDVAVAVGVSSSTYGRYEAALTMPDDPTLFRIAAYFGVTPAWLRYGQEPRKASAPPPMRSLGEIERMPEPEQASKPVRNIAGARKRRPR